MLIEKRGTMHFLFLLFLIVIVSTCGDPDYFRPARVTEADHPLADVFKPWDGTWRGVFFIYEDTLHPERPASPKEFGSWNGRVVRDSISVSQTYRSESPFFQRVSITDHYPGRIVESTGVNKVENGRMVCIIKKPGELIIHDGQRVGTSTIVWSRDERKPLRKEYFLETATDSTYQIEGWGYYEGDALTHGPRMWFKAQYTKE